MSQFFVLLSKAASQLLFYLLAKLSTQVQVYGKHSCKQYCYFTSTLLSNIAGLNPCQNRALINIWFVRYLCLHFSKVLVKRCSFGQNGKIFNLAKLVKLTNSSPFKLFTWGLINCYFCPNVCSVVPTVWNQDKYKSCFFH